MEKMRKRKRVEYSEARNGVFASSSFFFFHLKKILGRGGGSLLLRSGVRPAAKVNGEMRQLLQGRD